MTEFMRPKIQTTTSFPVNIFIAGDYDRAVRCAKAYCDEVGYCVSVTPTKYVYSGGEEGGVIVGLINYPRFPRNNDEIIDHAFVLSERLRKALDQKSYSIQTPKMTIWYSFRPEDISND
jgi:hypothetical protein